MANLGWPAVVLATGGMVWRGVGLLAQVAPADPISGGAGWVGAGLLGLVLGWLLLKYIPAKDAQFERLMLDRSTAIKEAVSTFETQVRENRNAFETQLREARVEYKEALAAVLDRHEKDYMELAEVIRQEFVRAGVGGRV